MTISKEEREAYSNGQEERNFINDHPFSYLATGGIHSRPEDSELANAYNKGLSGKQLDGDKK